MEQFAADIRMDFCHSVSQINHKSQSFLYAKLYGMMLF